MLANHDTLGPEDLYTISAGGFSATADAFARDADSQGLWFLSMVGSQTALKAIWASLLKQPPDVAHIIKGAEGMALSEGYQRCSIPYATIGTWTTKIAKLPVSGGWHALVYTKTAEYAFRAGRLPAAGAERGGSAGDSPPIPRQEKPSPPAPLLDRLALGPGPGDRGDRAAPVLGGSSPTAATPMGSGSGRTSPMPWRREGWRCRRRREGKMDRTLKRAKRSSKRRNHRNVGAWRRFSPDGTTCRFCEHDGSAHLCASAQPHFYRRATEEERGDPRVTLYRHDTPEGGSALVRRVVVASHAELITAFCTACAEKAGTSQVLCYQRTLATGEVVGVGTNNTKGDGP